MAEDVSRRHHAIDYVELAAPDLPVAQSFYAEAFGWRFHEYGGAYTGIVAPDGEGEAGGLNPSTEPGAGGVLVLVYSEDLDATRDTVCSAGGRILVEPYGFPGGRRFHFTDPAGNELAVWSSD